MATKAKKKRIGDGVMGALIGAAATLIVGGLVFVSTNRGQQIELQRLQFEKDTAERERADTVESYKRQLEAAQSRFTNSLGGLIDEASKEARRTEGPSQLIPAAKALVSARNGFRTSLESVSQRLDSEIDQLERELSANQPNQARIAGLVEVLKRKWPAKKEEIDLAVRKIITELGLVPES